MKKIILLLLVLTSLAFSAIDEYKTDVYFGNGILTKQQAAKDNAFLLEDAIKEKFGLDYYNKHIGKVDYAYNKTIGDKGDLWESFYQIIGQQESVDWWANIALWFVDKKTIHSIDIEAQVDKYEASIRSGHKVLVVAHSQGNLFAHEAYVKLGERSKDKWYQQYWEAVSIASPDPYTDIKPDMLPRIGWNNDLVARMGYGGRKIGIDCDVVHVTWEAKPHFIDHPIPAKPTSPYVNRSQIDDTYRDWWKASNGWKDNLDSNVHAFTFYMGLKLKEGDEKNPLYAKYKDGYTNPLSNNALLTDGTAKILIMDQIDTLLNKLDKKPSQYTIKENLGCLCRDKYVKMEHQFGDVNLTRQIAKHKIKNFAGEDKGKIYQVGSQYVRAACGGERIEEINEGEACLALMDQDNTTLGEITGLRVKPEAHAGVVEVKAAWNKPALDYDLVVQWDAGETDIKDTGCPEEHFYISSEKEIYPGKYPVFVVPKDPTDPIWDDPSIYPHTFTATITTPGKGADAQWKATATIHSRAGQTQFGHIADIKVYRTGDDDPKDPNDPNDAPPSNSPIQFEPLVPPECPPVTVTPPTVEPRPVYSGGGGGLLWCRDRGGVNCWEGGWYWNNNNFGTGGGASVPVQDDPACSGDHDCLPSPQDDPDNDDDPDTPFGTPPPKAGGVPPRDFNETDECTGDYSCYCIPCEYKIIPYLKQIYFGPLQDANYTIYSLEGYRNDTPVYKGKTTHGEGLYDSGEIHIPKHILEGFEDDRYYIIEAVGGEDIDTDDDFVVDAAPTPNKGKVYAIATGREIKYVGFKVNILTTVSFTLAKESIEGNATAEQIEEKLSDIASRLLRYKLYPDKTQSSITNTDILVWLPTTDQDVLLKSYTKLAKMVEDIYQGHPIYEDAYAYVYGVEDNNISDPQPLPPIIRSFSGTISESAPGGTLVGKIEVLRGGEDVVFGALSGKGSEKFALSPTGEISLKEHETLDYEQKWLYILKAEAHNSHGNSGKVSVFISIEDVIDAPKFVSLEGGSIEENATAGTIAGRLHYDVGASSIERIQLSGTSKDLFSVDSNGTIRLAEGASLDYETSRYYGFVVQAYNSYGTSIPTIIYLYVKDIEDVPKITGYTGGYVSENAPAGSVVGSVQFDSGASPVTQAQLTGIGAENFTIDTNGTVSVADDADLDYEQYSLYRLTAVLGNAMGEGSYPIFVSIRDAADVPGYLSFEGGNVDENSLPGTEVGRVIYDPGASPVTSMVLSGDDAHYFAIDTQGYITLRAAVDYESKHAFVVYVTAANVQGNSQKLTLHLFANDLPEEAAVLDDTVYNDVEENLTVGSRLGSVHILYEGSSEIGSFALSGEGADAFAVDRDGNITLERLLDFEKQSIYNLQLKARNEAGYSREVNLIIRLKDVADTPPKLKNLTASVREDVAVDTEIAVIEVETQGDTPITSFSLSGAGSDLFELDTNGTIRIAGAIDYEQKRSYDLQVKAQSSAGESAPAQVHIVVENVPEFVPVLKVFTGSVEENTTIGTTVGQIKEDVGGDTPVVSYTLDSNSTFGVDANGIIRVHAALDYETQTQYILTVTATNAAGPSEPVSVNINITNVMDDEPMLNDTSFVIPENAAIGTVLGKVDINTAGTSAITSMRLEGIGAENFSIDTNGTVRVAGSIDYEAKKIYHLKAIATNTKTDSPEALVTVEVENVAEIAPVLKPSVLSIKENNIIGAIVGSVSLESAGDTPISAYELNATEVFEIDQNGTIKTKKALDYESQKEYRIKARAKNQAGAGGWVDIPIHVTDEPDTVPGVRRTDLKVEENATVGTVVGRISMVSPGDSPILRFEIVPDEYTTWPGGYFSIDNNGTVRVGSNASLDYEKRSEYITGIKAINQTGASKKVYLRIYVKNIVDAPPHCYGDTIEIGPVSKSILVNSEIERVICYPGDSPFVSAKLEPTSLFEAVIVPEELGRISIRVKDSLTNIDSYEYNLSLSVTNATGESNKRPVRIVIDRNGYVFDMMQGDLDKVFGKINIEDKTVSHVETDNRFFSIDKNGTLSRNSRENTGEYKPQYAFKINVTYDDRSKKEVSVVVNVQNRILSKLLLPGEPGEIILNNAKNRAYVCNNDGMVVVNIEDPAYPEIISSVTTDGEVKDILLSKDEHYVYLLDAGKGLKVVDIENEVSPEIVGELLLSGSTYQYGGFDLSADGTRLYIAHKKEITVVDMQDNLLPEVIATIPYLGKIQYNVQPYIFKDVMLSSKGTELYAIDACYGLQEYNISDTEHPKILYSESIDNDYSCRMQENIVANQEKSIIFTTPESGYSGMEGYTEQHGLAEKISHATDAKFDLVDHDTAYQAYGRFRIYDIYNPVQPAMILAINFNQKFGDALNGIALDREKHIAYVTNKNSGLIAINVDNIKQPIHHEPAIAGATIGIAEENLSLITTDDVLGHVSILKTGSTPILNMWTDLPKYKSGGVDCGYTYYAQQIDKSCENDYKYFHVDKNGHIYINDADSLVYENIGNMAPFGVYAKNEDGYTSQQAKVMVNIIENPNWTIQFQRPVIRIDSNLSAGSVIANILQRKSQRALQLFDIYKYMNYYCDIYAVREYVSWDNYSYAEAMADACTRLDYFDISTNGDITLKEAVPEGNYSVNIFAVDRFDLRGLENLKIEVVTP